MSGRQPTVTIAVPVLNEAEHLPACLAAIAAQSYSAIVEVLVVDGGSTDGTADIAAACTGVRVLMNPRRIQAAALNLALDQAVGEVFVRVDGHCVIAPDYVERCVEALADPGIAMVGGRMTPRPEGAQQLAVAAALTSAIGAGPARFHIGGPPGPVDSVYLGAFRTSDARAIGGYDLVPTNEDAEFAHRMRARGHVWFDDRIRSAYVPRSTLVAVGAQFFRYGRGRARTVRKHPRSLAARQLAPVALVIGLSSPWRRPLLGGYLALVAGAGVHRLGRQPEAVARFVITLPTMHLSWALGFLFGLIRRDAA